MTDGIKTNIRTQLLDILNVQYKNEIAPIEIRFDKARLTYCPKEEDIRGVADTEFRKHLVDLGYNYLSGKSNCDELYISKYVVHPMDFSDIRLGTKIMLHITTGDADSIEKPYNLYYDETNNVKKFWLNEKKNKFNVSPDTIFVLGGIEANDCITFNELRDLLNLQNNVTEVKSHNVYDGQLSDCMKSDRLETILNLLLSKGWHVHFQSLNILYWSIVDILDTIDGFKMQDIELTRALKAMLYRIMKVDDRWFFELVLKYRYPNLRKTDIEPFYQDLVKKCDSYVIDNLNPSLPFLKKLLVNWLRKASHQTRAILIQDEPELILLRELASCYRCEVATWINSQIIFDNEADIIYELKSRPVSIDDKIVSNYKFVDSKTDTMLQLSDIVVGIIARYLTFIDKNGLGLPDIVKSTFNDKQKRIFAKLNKLLRVSRDFNPAFLHQTTSIEYHGLLNQYIDKYAI